jgi:hypothetical protein
MYVCFIICIFATPTSALATSGTTYSNQNFYESIYSFIFNGNKEAESWGNKQSYKNDRDDWDDWKHKDKDWDGCLKKSKHCIESIDIWRKWYTGKDKYHDYDKDDWDYHDKNIKNKWTWW